MKFALGWYFPGGEQHLIEWLSQQKNPVLMNGRLAYQGAKQKACLDLCKKRRAAVDIGAHIGLWSFNLAHEFGIVHAFEPVPAHRACFSKNVEMPNVELYARALGEEVGMVAIHTAPTSSGDSWVDGKGGIPMDRLDDHNLQNIDFIKADCEGYELHALRGAEATIKEWRPVICVEQKPGRAQKFGLPETGAVEYLKSLGYKLEREMSGDFIMVPA